MDKLPGLQSHQKVKNPLENQYRYSHQIAPLYFTGVPSKQPAQRVRTFLLWCTHTIEIRLPALKAMGVRALWALIGLNGPDQPHLGLHPHPLPMGRRSI